MIAAALEIPWVDITIHSTSADLTAVQEKMNELMGQAGWDPVADEKHFNAVWQALEEVLVNAAKHGNDMVSEQLIYISHHINSETINISVKDSGPGFNPDKVADPTTDENLERPSGRGLLLINHFATDVEYIPHPTNVGCTNHIRIIRHRNHDNIVEQRKAAMLED